MHCENLLVYHLSRTTQQLTQIVRPTRPLSGHCLAFVVADQPPPSSRPPAPRRFFVVWPLLFPGLPPALQCPSPHRLLPLEPRLRGWHLAEMRVTEGAHVCPFSSFYQKVAHHVRAHRHSIHRYKAACETYSAHRPSDDDNLPSSWRRILPPERPFFYQHFTPTIDASSRRTKTRR